MTNLEILMKNAKVDDPKKIIAYLIGMAGEYDEKKVPKWMEPLRHQRHRNNPWAFSFPYFYQFEIPWNRNTTRKTLQRIVDEVDDDHLVSGAKWGLAALDEQERME